MMQVSQLVLNSEDIPMRSLSRTSLLFGLAMLGVPLFGEDAARGQAGKAVDFKTFDGVTIKGTFYPSTGSKIDAVVMILHDFSAKKGGGSSQDGIPALA